MASVRQALLSTAGSPAADAFGSGKQGPESRGTDHLEYVTTEDETTADIGDLEAELARERERQATLDKERKVLELRAQIASLRAKNVAQGATLGPFDHNPLGDFPIAVSPLNSVPKSETSERRIILDLSFPPGRGVNDGIERNMFLGEAYKLRLSGTDDMVDLIHRKGSGYLLFKRDLSRAFRQFPVDPADLDKLGFEWRGKLYLDRVLAMGLRTAGIACQRATNILVYICKQSDVEILNYLDDLGGAEVEERAQWTFEFLGELLEKLGFTESVAKACASATRMVFLGIMFDTLKMVMEVTPERVQDTLEEVARWATKENTSQASRAGVGTDRVPGPEWVG